jgi:hypothetical protein
VKYWEIIADNLSKSGWSWGCVAAIDSNGRTIFVADAHRDDGKRFVVRADEKLTAFLELESAVLGAFVLVSVDWLNLPCVEAVFHRRLSLVIGHLVVAVADREIRFHASGFQFRFHFHELREIDIGRAVAAKSNGFRQVWRWRWWGWFNWNRTSIIRRKFTRELSFQ